MSGPGTKAVGTITGNHASGYFPTTIGHGSSCTWEATLIVPAKARPPSRKEEANAEFCGLSLGKKLTACAGSDEKCACVTLRNNCPYPVSVRGRLSGVKGSGLISTNVNGGKTDSLCATRDSSQQIEYLGWKPWAGYPKKGQPRPKGN